MFDGLRTLALDVALAEVLCRGTPRSGIACADQALAMLPEEARPEFRAWTEDRIRSREDPRGTRRGMALLDLANGLAESPPESWLLLSLDRLPGNEVTLTHETIAELLGVRRESVSAVAGRLQTAGLIRCRSCQFNTQTSRSGREVRPRTKRSGRN